MKTCLLFLMVVICGCVPESPRMYHRDNWREAFIELNAETLSLSNVLRDRGIQATNLTLVDVGSAPNSGDGDLISVAVRKAARNLAVCREALGGKQ